MKLAFSILDTVLIFLSFGAVGMQLDPATLGASPTGNSEGATRRPPRRRPSWARNGIENIDRVADTKAGSPKARVTSP